MHTVLVTGSEGIVGSVLCDGLKHKYRVVGVDLPEDISRYEVLQRRLAGVHSVIHLARRGFDGPVERHMRIYPQNVRIDANVFTAVVRAHVPRLILASSVHADNHRDPHIEGPLTVPGSYYPATPYGVYKLIEEEAGRVLAEQFGFEFVGVRLGGVTRDDSVKRGAGQTATWLSHRDLVGAFDACLAATPVPGRASVFYAVSNNADTIHDTANPFGWKPRDNSAEHA